MQGRGNMYKGGETGKGLGKKTATVDENIKWWRIRKEETEEKWAREGERHIRKWGTEQRNKKMGS